MATDRPNVLFFICDQWSARAADGSGENPDIRTPHIDALAATGARFSRAYSAWPVCSPARASFFTGQMPHTHGGLGNFDADIVPRSHPTLSEVFAQAGYETAYFGKDHTGTAALRGVEELGQTHVKSCGNAVDGMLCDPVFARDAVDFIHRDREKPFYMVCSFVNPHDIARDGAAGSTGLSDKCARWTDWPRYLRGQPYPALPPNYESAPRRRLGSRALRHYHAVDWQRYIATYYLLIENADWLIGLVLDALKASAQSENTVVIFTTDHGDMMGAHRMIQKGTCYEEAARVPFLVRAPGVTTPGTVCDELVSGIDVYPTFCDCAGLSSPGGVEGRSLRPLLSGEDAAWRETLVMELAEGRMVRWGDWKYCAYYAEDGNEEYLFHLGEDPGEVRDLAPYADYADILADGRARLEAWTGETGGTWASTRIQSP